MECGDKGVKSSEVHKHRQKIPLSLCAPSRNWHSIRILQPRLVSRTAQIISSALILLLFFYLHLYSIQLQLYGLHTLPEEYTILKEVFGFVTFFWKSPVSVAHPKSPIFAIQYRSLHCTGPDPRADCYGLFPHRK